MTRNQPDQSSSTLLQRALADHQAGRLDAAERGYRQILARQANHADALHLLGLIAHQKLDHRAAVDLINRAIALNRRVPAYYNNLGEGHRKLGDHEQGVRCARTALSLQPNNPGTMHNLGRALQSQEKLAEAIEQFERIARLKPDSTVSHTDLGMAFKKKGDVLRAIEAFRRALVIDPDLTDVRIYMARLLVQAGKFDQAAEHFRRGFREGGNRVRVFTQLAKMLKGRLPDQDMAVIDEILADPDLSPFRRVRMLFSVAHVYDTRGEYGKAADATAEANAIQKTVREQRKKPYDPKEHHRFIQRMIDAFTPELFARLRGFGSDSQRQVFILGLPRSGTSLTEQVLACHPQVFGAGELKLVPDLFSILPAMTSQNGPPAQCARALLNSLAELDQAAPRVVDKLPDNYFYLGLIAALFPNARVIHCRRDLRDVAVSCWITGFALIHWSNHFDHIATRFAEYRRIIDHWRSVQSWKSITKRRWRIWSRSRDDWSTGSVWNGIRRAWLFTSRTDRFSPPAQPRSASRSTTAPWPGGKTTSPPLTRCSSGCPRPEPNAIAASILKRDQRCPSASHNSR